MTRRQRFQHLTSVSTPGFEEPGPVNKPRTLFDAIRPGTYVTILVPNGTGRNGVEYKEATGRAVMFGPGGWVLNMGGRHGTPGIATEENTTRVSNKKVKK